GFEQLAAAERGGVLGGVEPLLDDFLANSLGVDAAAVIADGDADLVALLARVDGDFADGIFAGGDALRSALNAVIERVAQDVNERVVDVLDHGFVDLGFLPGDGDLNLFSDLVGEFADQTGKFAKDVVDGHHACAQAGVLQFVGDKA